MKAFFSPPNCPLDTARAQRSVFLGIAVLTTSAALLAGCGKKPAAAAGPPRTGPAAVSVLTLAPTPVPLIRELPGRISALRYAEVRARVDGIVLQRFFAEGAEVKEGQPLYQIDPAPYRATVDSAKATLARAEANVASAQLVFDRDRDLSNAKAISGQEYDNAVASLAVAKADVAVAQAAARTAEISLAYTTVTSPITGRIGRSSVTAGAYVQQAQATLLATIQQLDRVYVDLTQSSAELLKLKADVTNRRIQSSSEQAPATLILEDGETYPEEGAVQFSDVSVGAATGSVILRAIFPNPHGVLLPGSFVRARVEMGVVPDALLVPQTAVSRDGRGTASVLLIGEGNRATPRVINVDRTIGINWLVTAGIAAGDRVIVDGLQHIRPGAEVRVDPSVRSEGKQSAALTLAR